MSNHLETVVAEALEERLFAGDSLRQIARSLEVSTNTVRRYKGLLGARLSDVRCPCGEPAFHRGWCAHRYAQSPARQLFMAKWLAGRPPKVIRLKSTPRLDLNYPFIAPTTPASDAQDLVLFVNGSVPKGLPEQLRADVCQEILLAVVAGELERTEIPLAVRKFITKARRDSNVHYMAFSIDAPRRDGRSWHDILEAQ